jgi:7-carboxy-7-deazaguanine synthase
MGCFNCRLPTADCPLAMKVNEIFYSIQGESSYAGQPCAFIRLTGCNLRCSYCDSDYAFLGGMELSVAEILQEIGEYPTRLVLVTGGEPMLQSAVYELFSALLERGYTVLLETGGQVSLANVDARVHKIMDFKCPSSGMEEHNDYHNVQYLTRNDEVKFVIGDRDDFDWACAIIRKYDLTERAGAVHCSPIFGKITYEDLAEWVLHCGLPIRLQLQLHKIIWPNIVRGV